jgi:hypothetical protein
VNQAIIAQQIKHRTRHDYTVDTILEELDEARGVALGLEQPQTSAAVQASTVKARMLGFIVDKKEIGAPGDFAALDTMQAVMALVGKELGQNVADALAKALTADTNPPTIDLEPNSDGE